MVEPQDYSSFQAVLLQRGVMTEAELRDVKSEAGRMPLDKFLLQNKRVDPEVMLLAVASYFNMRPIALRGSFLPPRKLVDLAPPDFWVRVKAVPLMHK